MIQGDDARGVMWLIIYLLQAVYHVGVSYAVSCVGIMPTQKKGAYAPAGSPSINASQSGQGCPKYFFCMQSNATWRKRSKFSMYP